MALTDIFKVKIRKHLGYGVAGLYRQSPAGGTLAPGAIGYRFFQAYGHLEYRMNNLSGSEEAMITGFAVGAISFIGTPAVGDVFTVNLSGGGLSTPVTLTATAAAGDQNTNIAAKIAAAANLNATLQQAGLYAVAPYGTGPFSPTDNVPLPEVTFQGSAAFILTASAVVSGTCAPRVTAQGAVIGPAATIDGVNTLVGHVPILDGLEGAIVSASQNFDTRQADVWKGRGSEMALRVAA